MGDDPGDTAPLEDAAPVAWDEARAAWWLAGAEEREKQLLPVSDALFARQRCSRASTFSTWVLALGRPPGRRGMRSIRAGRSPVWTSPRR